MQNKHIGWTLFLGALGMLFTLEAVEVSNLHTWSDATAPSFIAKLLAHTGTVIGAYFGGKKIAQDEQGE